MRGVVRTSRGAANAVAIAWGLLSLAACSTTVDETRPGGADATVSPGTGDAAVVFDIPSDTRGQMARIVNLAGGLGNRIIDGGAASVEAELIALWAAARPTVQRNEPIEVVAMDDQFELIGRSVRFKRAADADKAARFLGLLFDDYLTKHPS